MFNKQTAADMANALTNCEAYENYKKTIIRKDELIKKSMENAEKKIEYELKNNINNGRFKSKTKLFIFLNKYQREYLKNIYIEKGYKIKFFSYIGFNDYLHLSKITVIYLNWNFKGE